MREISTQEEFIKEINLQNFKKTGEVFINKIKFTYDPIISIGDQYPENLSTHFQNCEFPYVIRTFNTNQNRILFNSCKINWLKSYGNCKELKIDNSTIEYGVISGVGSSARNLMINNGSSITKFEFQNSDDSFHLHIGARCKIATLNINGEKKNENKITIEEGALIEKGFITDSIISSLTVKQKDPQIDILTISDFQSNDLRFEFLLDRKMTFSFLRESTVGKMQCRGYSWNQNLNLNDTKIEILDFQDFESQESKIKIHRGSISHLIFKNTTLHNQTVFDNVNISKFTLLTSYIEEVKFIHCIWPNNYQIEFDPNNESKGYHSLIRESYSQLSRIIAKYNSPLEGVVFKLHERKMFLLESKREIKKTKIITSKEYWDLKGNILLLDIDRLVSNFGQNVWKPLVLLFVFHLAFFCILTNTTEELKIGFGGAYDGETTWRAFNMYFQTLLPVHSSDIRIPPDNQIVSFGGVVDFVMRISSGYFIYYFLRATKKFHFT